MSAWCREVTLENAEKGNNDDKGEQERERERERKTKDWHNLFIHALWRGGVCVLATLWRASSLWDDVCLAMKRARSDIKMHTTAL